jgi:hypothetical protein
MKAIVILALVIGGAVAGARWLAGLRPGARRPAPAPVSGTWWWIGLLAIGLVGVLIIAVRSGNRN